MVWSAVFAVFFLVASFPSVQANYLHQEVTGHALSFQSPLLFSVGTIAGLVAAYFVFIRFNLHEKVRRKRRSSLIKKEKNHI